MIRFFLLLLCSVIFSGQIIMSPARFASGGAPAHVRNQILLAGIADNLSAAATEYNSVIGGSAWNGTATHIKNIFPCAGVLKHLRIRLSAAPTSTNSWTFTVTNAGGATALAVTITGTDITGYNSTDSVSVAAGAWIQLTSTYSGTPAAAQARWSMEFKPTNTNYTVIGMATETNQADASTEYIQAMGSHVTWETAAANAYQIMPAAGTLSRMYVLASAAPGAGGLTFTLMKNDTARALTVGLTTADNGLDTTHSVSVAAGDRICLRSVSGTITNSRTTVGMVFTPTTQGQVICLGGSDDVPATTENIYPIGAGSTWSSTSGVRTQLTAKDITLKNFYVNLSANPGAGSTITLTIRDNGVATPLSVTITESGNTGYDLDSVNIAAGKLIDINCTITGTLGTVYVRWGFVQSDNDLEVPVWASKAMLAWDGKYAAGDTTTTWADSGASTKAGTPNAVTFAKYSDDIVYMIFNADNDKLEWVIDSTIVNIDDAAGYTVYIQANIRTAATNVQFWELEGNSTHWVVGYFNATPDFSGWWNSSSDNVTRGSGVASSTWITLGISWDLDGNPDFAAYYAGEWAQENDDPTNFAVPVDAVRLGADIFGSAAGIYWISKFCILKGWQTPCPWQP